MTFRKIWLQSQRSFGFGTGFRLPTVSRFIITENFSTNRCEPRVSEREIWIEFDRLRIKLFGGLVILQQRIGVTGDLVRAQIKNVRIGVRCWFRFNTGFFLWRKRGLQRVSDHFCNLGFYAENVGQLAVVTLRPEMRIVVGPDQLHVDVHAIAGLLDTAFEYMAHAQLARDLRQILRRTAVARSGSTRDYAKPADPRQRGDDFVLNTLCKKCVVFFRTEILERQHCYAFLLGERSR